MTGNQIKEYCIPVKSEWRPGLKGQISVSIKWTVCCKQEGDQAIKCKLYEDAKKEMPTLEFLFDQEDGEVKVTSEAPAKAIALEADGIRRAVKQVLMAY